MVTNEVKLLGYQNRLSKIRSRCRTAEDSKKSQGVVRRLKRQIKNLSN